ncbi:MAG: hypothetical protein QMD44_02370 [Thermodesulfovibrionales bacterium]|jgi:hypothetical protein|nr:hypothetical protein [Thermodesulfovibrionales bacterium]
MEFHSFKDIISLLWYFVIEKYGSKNQIPFYHFLWAEAVANDSGRL